MQDISGPPLPPPVTSSSSIFTSKPFCFALREPALDGGPRLYSHSQADLKCKRCLTENKFCQYTLEAKNNGKAVRRRTCQECSWGMATCSNEKDGKVVVPDEEATGMVTNASSHPRLKEVVIKPKVDTDQDDSNEPEHDPSELDPSLLLVESDTTLPLPGPDQPLRQSEPKVDLLANSDTSAEANEEQIEGDGVEKSELRKEKAQSGENKRHLSNDDDIPEVQKRPRPNSLDVSTPNPATSSLVIDIAQTVSQLPRERDEQVKTLFGSIYSYLVRKHQDLQPKRDALKRSQEIKESLAKELASQENLINLHRRNPRLTSPSPSTSPASPAVDPATEQLKKEIALWKQKLADEDKRYSELTDLTHDAA